MSDLLQSGRDLLTEFDRIARDPRFSQIDIDTKAARDFRQALQAHCERRGEKKITNMAAFLTECRVKE